MKLASRAVDSKAIPDASSFLRPKAIPSIDIHPPTAKTRLKTVLNQTGSSRELELCSTVSGAITAIVPANAIPIENQNTTGCSATYLLRNFISDSAQHGDD